MHLHLYADDSQMYTSVAVSDITSAVHCLTAFIADVNNWMSASRLCFNPSKMEIICGWVQGICSNKLTSVTSLSCLSPSESCSRRMTLMSYYTASCHSLLTLLRCVSLASISCDRSDQLSGHSHLTLPGLLFRRLLPVVWTGATRFCMVCQRTCCESTERQYRTLLLHTHQRMQMYHSTAASVTLATSPETSGIQECVSCTPVASFTCTDLPDY